MTEWTQLSEARFANLSPLQIVMKERAREIYEDLDELAETIKDKGLIQPIAVQETEDPELFLLLAGGRRFAAMVRAKLMPIPARIFPKDMDELDRKEIELVENIYRKDMRWQEKSRLEREIHELFVKKYGEATSGGPGGVDRGHSMADTAAILGKDRTGVGKSIALANALDDHPELAAAKNEAEARNILRKLRRTQEDRTVQERFDKVVQNDGVDRIRYRLGNAYTQGDFFERCAELPGGNASLVEIDPPYGIDLQYMKDTNTQVMEGYTDVPTDEYIEFMRRVFKESHRMIGSSGWLICWYAHHWYEVIKNLLRETGFTVGDVPAVWIKPSYAGQTRHPDLYLSSTYEPFMYARKGTYAAIRQQGRNNVFDFATLPSARKVHPTERPIELMEEIIKTFSVPDGCVMVPFLGSGNTLLAAANLGMWGYGFDLDKNNEYKPAYVRKVMEGEPKKYKSYSVV